MNNITLSTRQLSFEDIKEKRQKRYVEILDRLESGNKTAKEIAVELFEMGLIPSAERNYTAPRLTELEKLGKVKVADKKKCQWTGKTVAIYTIVNEEEYFEENMNHIPGI